MIRVLITFSSPAQLAAFRRGLGWQVEEVAPLTLVVDVPAPFDDVAGVRDALRPVWGRVSWSILEGDNV